jgi:putative membrane protein
MLFASLNTLPSFILYFIIALILTAAFIAAYIQITPYNEFELIQEGNTAAALSLGGAVTGFVLALAAVIKHSVNVVDLSIWGLIALGIQIGAYAIAKKLIQGLEDDVQEGKTAQGLFLGLLNAACLTP